MSCHLQFFLLLIVLLAPSIVNIQHDKYTAATWSGEKPKEEVEAAEKEEVVADSESVEEKSVEEKPQEEPKAVEKEEDATDDKTAEAEPVEEKKIEENKKNVKKDLDNVSSDEKTDTAENAVETESKDEK